MIYTTKAERSVSKQGHLQPCCQARSLSKELWKWPDSPWSFFWRRASLIETRDSRNGMLGGNTVNVCLSTKIKSVTRQIIQNINKLMSVFHVSVLLLIINFIITLSSSCHSWGSTRLQPQCMKQDGWCISKCQTTRPLDNLPQTTRSWSSDSVVDKRIKNNLFGSG